MSGGGGLILIVLGGLLVWMAATGKIGPCASCFSSCVKGGAGAAGVTPSGVVSSNGLSPTQLIGGFPSNQPTGLTIA